MDNACSGGDFASGGWRPVLMWKSGGGVNEEGQGVRGGATAQKKENRTGNL